MNVARYIDDNRYEPSVLLLGGLSSALALLTVWHITTHNEPVLGRLIGFGAVLFPGILVLGGAVWLGFGDFDPTEARRVVGWSLVGAVAITVLGGVIVVYEWTHGVSLAHPVIVTGWIAGAGSVGGFLTGVYDVLRERRRDRYETASQRLRAIIEASPVAIAAVDADGNVTDWSQAAEEMFGWERADVLGEQYPLVPDHHESEFRQNLRRVNDGDVLDGIETVRQCKDGSLLDVRIWSAPVEHEDTTEHMIAIADISEQVERQRDLRLLRRAIQQAEDAVLVTDRNGVIEYVNEAFVEMSGYERAEALGRTPRILKSGHHDEQFYEQLWSTITEGNVWHSEITNRRKTGERVEVELTIAPVEDGDEITHFVAIERDVTDRKRDKQRLNVLNRVLRHNVRNAITVVQGNAAKLEDGLASSPDAQVALDDIESRLGDLQSTVEKARTVERALDIEHVGPTNLTDVLTTQRDVFETQDSSETVELEVEEDLWVVGNATLDAAIQEAIENAFEHSTDARPTVRVTAHPQSDETVAVRIVDDGPGVPDYERRVIENGGESALEHGSGIGLWMIKWVVNSVGGDVTIAEADTGGTAVTITLPRADPPE